MLAISTDCAPFYRSVAIEIVDGEMEMLAAGGWKSAPMGDSSLSVTANSAKSLPAGSFVVTRNDRTLTLRWVPAKQGHGGAVEREITIPPER